jgi:hypothetical protein
MGGNAGARFVIPIARWSTWPPARAEGAEAPEVRFVDASLRRRLGPLARMMLHVANACAQGMPDLRLVFASQHGELSYTIALLRALAAGEPLSPTAFGLSVHNAAAGLFATVRGDRAESTALAAGEETLGHALLESYCQFAADPRKPVLMVYGDQALPHEYRQFGSARDRSEAQGRAVAVLLSADASRRTVVRAEAAGDVAASEEAQAESFIRHLAESHPGRWIGTGRAWSWH